jgi:high-affinity iron transporter
VLRLTTGAGELLEGIAMLLASGVLFFVSYWIISKAEADRWQRYIRGKVERAAAAGKGTALAAAAFLAVYREGFETVLFYQALVGSAPAGDLMVPAGLVAGLALLALVYLGLARFGLRIPIRPFFLATGTILYAMAVVFAGKGVHELQSAGAIGVTVVPWMGSIDALGVYPTVQSLLAQGGLLVLVGYGLILTLRRSRRPASAELTALRTELDRLRALAETMRAEVATLRTPEAAAVAGRLEGLLGEVRALEERVASSNGRG